MIDKITAIISLVPDAEVTVYDEKEIVWHKPDIAPITEAEIEAEQIRLDAEFNAKDYQRKRAAEYPSINDYLDGIVKGDTAQVQAYINACLAVKAKYPKGQ